MERRAAPLMDLPDVIAAAWGLCARHWAALLRTAILPVALWTAVSTGLYRAIPAVSEDQAISSEQTRRALVNGTPWIVALTVLGILTHLALLRTALDLFHGGNPRVRRALASAFLSLVPVTGFYVLITVLAVAAIALTVALGLSPVGWALLLGLTLTRWGRRARGATWRATREALSTATGVLVAPQIAVDQRAGLIESVRGARSLVRGQAWRTLGVGLAVFVVSLLPGFVLARIGAALGSDVWAVLAGGVAMLLQAPFLAAGHAQLYLDLRARHGEAPRTASRSEREAL